MVNKEALDTLQNYGIHPSVQRIAIMDYLLKNHTHPTVDEVYVALCKAVSYTHLTLPTKLEV